MNQFKKRMVLIKNHVSIHKDVYAITTGTIGISVAVILVVKKLENDYVSLNKLVYNPLAPEEFFTPEAIAYLNS